MRQFGESLHAANSKLNLAKSDNNQGVLGDKMATKSIFKLKINDHVLIDAPEDSIGAKYNDQVGRVTGFVHDWFVVVNIKGEVLRFRPDELVSLA
jgi:hypothetical protein